jgi:hypothetical protein
MPIAAEVLTSLDCPSARKEERQEGRREGKQREKGRK